MANKLLLGIGALVGLVVVSKMASGSSSGGGGSGSSKLTEAQVTAAAKEAEANAAKAKAAADAAAGAKTAADAAAAAAAAKAAADKAAAIAKNALAASQADPDNGSKGSDASAAMASAAAAKLAADAATKSAQGQASLSYQPGAPKTVSPKMAGGFTVAQGVTSANRSLSAQVPGDSLDRIRSELLARQPQQSPVQVANQFDRGFIPGKFDPIMTVDDYTDSLGPSGLDRVDVILSPQARASLNELGSKTLIAGADPFVAQLARSLVEDGLGELGSWTTGDQHAVLSSHTTPALLAGAVAAAALGKNLARAQAAAVQAHQAYWASVGTGTPPDAHMYALANAWEAAKRS